MTGFIQSRQGTPDTAAYTLLQQTHRIDADTTETTAAFTAHSPLKEVGFGVTDIPFDADGARPDMSSLYVLVPAAVYDGNRFTVRPQNYPPIPAGEDRQLYPPVLINDIPRMKDEDPQLALRTGDGSSPLLALWDRAAGRACIYTYSPLSDGTPYRESGFMLQKNGEVRFCYPVIRPTIYRFGNTSAAPTQDALLDVPAGGTIKLTVRKTVFPCSSAAELYNRILSLRYQAGRGRAKNTLPLSEAFRIIRDKYDRRNWDETYGYFHVGVGTSIYDRFQTGWVGGGAEAYALVRGEGAVSDKAVRSLNFIYQKVQTASGLFYGIHDGEKAYGDDFRHVDDASFMLIRKSADILYLHSALFLYMKERGDAISPLWLDGLGRCADAFVRLWERYGQFGQFVDAETGDILVGGSFAGAAALGGLALYACLSGEERYLQAACDMARREYERFAAQGFTNGGPGEILSAPDSESAYALLESFTVLYEETGREEILRWAREAAAYAATWIMDYDYPFPEASLFGRLGMSSTGTVWASCQNKHSAPGICTHSGSAFLRLYLYTGEPLYLQMIEDIAHAITQYVSQPNRPLYDTEGVRLDNGFVCERVSTCDWEGYERIGQIFNGSNWSEMAAMMCFTDLPGVVVDEAAGRLAVLDHVEARLEGSALRLHNPWPYPVSVRILRTGQRKACRGWDLQRWCETVQLAPGETVVR